MHFRQSAALPSRAVHDYTRLRYAEDLIQAGSVLAVPEFLNGPWRDSVYTVRNRQGIAVMALPTWTLTDPQLETLLRFRFAQYVAAGFVDSSVAFRERLAHEPLGRERPDTVHFVAFSRTDGRLLSYLALQAAPEAPPGVTPRTRMRPLLPLEEHFGWGVLNRLNLLPELPMCRIRELGRFVKNHRLGTRHDLGVRAVVEVCLGVVRTLTGPLALDVSAFVGQFEDAVARKHLEFFHIPMVVVRGGMPAFHTERHAWPGFEGRARHPFAVLVSDMTKAARRLGAIEAALGRPGIDALLALRTHKPIGAEATSSLAPTGGLPDLIDLPLPQRDLAMPARIRARALGERLRRFAPFAALSTTESIALRTLVEEVEAAPGTAIVRRGETADALYLIERGEVDVLPHGSLARRRLGPGDCFGEIGVLTGRARTADVVACSHLKLLRLSAETYRQYLSGLADVDRGLTHIALDRAAAHLQPPG
jgi:hypothetical protein